jgi:hypothetical protein
LNGEYKLLTTHYLYPLIEGESSFRGMLNKGERRVSRAFLGNVYQKLKDIFDTSRGNYWNLT